MTTLRERQAIPHEEYQDFVRRQLDEVIAHCKELKGMPIHQWPLDWLCKLNDLSDGIAKVERAYSAEVERLFYDASNDDEV